jgi:UDP-N-acetylenolpyruvoylglucosamine reductase
MNMSEPAQFGTALRGTLRHDVDMSRHTSWRAGGRAERMYQPADLADLAVFLRSLPQDEPLYWVGLGSNLLVRDGGLRGTVLLMHAALGELRLEQDGAVYAQAGVPGAKLARFAALHDLGGAEFFAGIPGTLGGMLAMNAGCYGGETWNVVERVQVITRRGVLHERTRQDYDIGYRHVALRSSAEEWFVGAWLRLPAGDGATARAEVKALLARRIASQPLLQPNAGSVFRNPAGDHAARLIESCGLKGRRIGGAEVSQKHANFIVNVGGATAADIENLIDEVRAAVLRQSGIELHPEVRIIGEAK